jgi:putative ABC transport system substrate-binding protein
MKRRDFMGIIVAAATWPRAAGAQRTEKLRRIGFLGPAISKPSMMVANYQAFLEELRTLGFNEGRNLAIAYSEIDDPRGLSVIAAELVQSKPELIVVSGTEAMLRAALAPNRGIPIVLIAINFDPIERGYIASLARPGGNITGVIFRQLELAQKQVELLQQAFPGKTRLTILYDAQTADQFSAAEQRARSLNFQIEGVKLESPPYDFDAAFRRAAAGGAEMVLLQSSPHFIPLQFRIEELTKVYRLPTMFLFKPYVEAGGLMSYGVEFPPMYRRTADYVVKILKGAQPADLPAEQATKFEMVINLKTAKLIGIDLPTAMLLRADHVIE